MRKPFLRSTRQPWLFGVLLVAVLGGATTVSAAEEPAAREGRAVAAEVDASQTVQSQTPAKPEAVPQRRDSEAFVPSKRLPVDSPVSLPTDI